MKVLLVEEVPGRERLALMFLRKALLERGHDVLVSNSWELERDMRPFAPDIVVDNISDSTAHYLGKLALLGPHQRNVNLMWEQLPQPADIRRYRFDDTLQESLVDGRVSWGTKFKSVLCAINPAIDPDRVKVTGSMKYAVHGFYKAFPRTAFHRFYSIDFGSYDRIVLVADSTLHASKNLEKLRGQELAETSPFGGRYVSPFLYELALRQRSTRAATVRIVEALAKKHPRCLFVLRLHPSNDHLSFYADSYRKLLEIPNVEASTTGDITPLVYISDLVISSRSGSLVDAFMLGKPGVNLQVRNDPIDSLYLVECASNEFGTRMFEDEVLDADFEELFALSPKTPHWEQVARERFGVVSKEAFENVADFVEETFDREPLRKSVPLSRYIRRGVMNRHHPARRHLRNLVRRLGFVRKPPFDRSFEYSTLFEILEESWDMRERQNYVSAGKSGLPEMTDGR